MRPYTLIATRSRTETARVVVNADDESEAKRIAEDLARADDVLWESDVFEVTVEREGQ